MELWDNPIFQALLRSLEECVLAVDDDGCITGAHCSRENMLPEQQVVVGMSINAVFPVEVTHAFNVAIRTLRMTGLPQTVNYRLDLLAQRRHYSARLARPTLEGEPQGILVAIWDVTRQVLAQQTMLESEAFYRLLADNSSDMIVVEDVDGRFLYISPSIRRILGVEAEAMRGRYRHELIHPEDLERMLRDHPTRLPPPEGMQVRNRVRHSDGRWIWLESTVRTFEWQGRPALLSIARDISMRQQTEEELKLAHGRAEEANRAKSVFLASISHDLRTPLHGILGMSELLEQTHLTPEQQEYLTAIQQSGDTLLARLNDLLDLSKIESGELDLQQVDFDLVEAVEGLVDILGNEATSKGIELFCHVQAGVPPLVRGDPQRLRQVLINLIANAIKLTNQGEVDVQVGQGQDGALRFTVRDTAVGVADQVDQPASRWRRRVGGGLGLSVARQLVELMGGKLQTESRQPTGTLCSFELPWPASAKRSIDAQGRMLTGKRILATDDNATNRQLIREHLEHAGAEVELTSGGVETIRNLLDDPAYDCVVLNADLPDLDGFATAAMIRSNRTLEQLPLVLTISSADAGEVQRSKELQVNAVLTKPVRRDVLVRAVHGVITSGGFQDDQPPGREGTVLVVEDNEVNLRLARDILRLAGYAVVSARDGKEALAQLQQHSVDAVLMDIQLPDMDGLEATARIRGIPEWADIPIIAMTAHAMKGDAERFLRAGVDDCLSKPVNRLELLSTLERELARRSAAAAR